MGDQPKVYVPRSSVKEINFNGGGSMLKISFKVDDLIPFLQQHKNEKGYINLVCSKRKEVGQYGDTHSLILDTWKPGERQQSSSRPTTKPNPNPEVPPVEEDDVPF